MVKNSEFLQTYLKIEEFFSNELKFKPLRNPPDQIDMDVKNDQTAVNNLENATWSSNPEKTILHLTNGSVPLIKAILARECLLSFLPEGVRENYLLHLFIYLRLIHGKSPLSKRSVELLTDYYLTNIKSLEEEISKNKDILAWYGALDVVYPKKNIPDLFKRYFYDISNFHEFFRSHDIELLDIILNQTLDSFFYSKPYQRDEIYLIFEMMKLFQKTKLPFSLLDLKENIKTDSNSNGKLKIDPSRISDIYNELCEDNLDFKYQFNYEKIGISSLYLFIQFKPHIKKSVVDRLFTKFLYLTSKREKLSNRSIITAGYIFIPSAEMDIFGDWVDFLKNNGIAEDVLWIKFNKFKQCFNFVDGEVSLSSETNGNFDTNSNDLFPIDAIDCVIIDFLRTSGNRGFGIRIENIVQSLKSKLYLELNRYNSTLSKIKDLKKSLEEIKINSEILSLIIPDPTKIHNIDNFLTLDEFYEILLSKINILELQYYFENFSDVYRSLFELRHLRINLKDYNNLNQFLDNDWIKKNHSKSHFAIKNALELLKSFESKFFLTTDLETWIFENLFVLNNNLELQTALLNVFDIILQYIDITGENTDFELVEKNEELLQNYLHLPDDEILQDFNFRLQKYVDNNVFVPNMMSSIRLMNLFTLKTILLKNISLKDEKINILSKKFPYIYFFEQDHSNYTYVLIILAIHPSLSDHLTFTLTQLFSKEIVFSTSFFGRIYSPIFMLEKLFDLKSLKPKSIKSKFKFSKVLLGAYKTHNATPMVIPEKIFDISISNLPDRGLKIKNMHHDINFESLLCKNTAFETEFIRKFSLEQNFLEQSNLDSNLIKSVFPVPNYELFGFNSFIFQFRIQKSAINLKNNAEMLTSELFMCPGCSKILSSNDIGNFKEYLVYYIAPKDNPPLNLFNYANNRKLISNFTVMKVKRLHLGYNPLHLLESDRWSFSFKTWNFLAKKIMLNSEYHYNPNYVVYDFEEDSETQYGKSSTNLNIITRYWGKNLKAIYNLKNQDGLRNLIRSKIIHPIPEFNTEKMKLNEQIIVFFGPTNEFQKEKLLTALSLLPLVYVNEVEFTESNNGYNQEKGLLVEFFVPNSRIDELYTFFSEITDIFNIKLFQFIPGIKDVDFKEFSENKIKTKMNPFESYIWNGRTKKWNLPRYFDKEGIPLSHHDRLELLRKSRD